MAFMRLKICGVMRPEDAVAAAEVGADAVGMVLYPRARRCVSVETAQRIIAALPPLVVPVALFVDEEPSAIRQIAREMNVRHIQLHGHETPALAAELKQFTLLKALRADRATLAGELRAWRQASEGGALRHLAGWVMESPASAPGGTGVENDWDLIAELKQASAFDRPLIAAGGLRPDNVAAVIQRIGPYAVDVSSGVEESFGIKSPEKMQQFVRAVRQATGWAG